jgi:predicted transcriptional regulator/CheY-like chemotaxis protein
MKTVQHLLDHIHHKLWSIGPEATVYEGVERLSEGNFGALPVVEDGRLVGIFSERDYARKIILLGRSSKDTKIRDVMTANPISLTPGQTIEECMRLMTEKGFRHLPVLKGGELIGMISIKDAVSAVISDKELAIDYALHAGKQKNEYLKKLKDMTFEKVVSLNKVYLHPLRDTLAEIQRRTSGEVQTSILGLTQGLGEMMDVLDHVSRWYFSEKAMESKRVLLAEDDQKEQIIARMALGGTGADLDIVATVDEGKERLSKAPYDILCAAPSMMELAEVAARANPGIHIVFLTSEDMSGCLSILRRHSQLRNIVSRNRRDRSFTVKSILTTVSKLVTRDCFGLEKYLSWGVDVQELPVTGSESRRGLRDRMENYFRGLGLRRSILGRCAAAADELLLNAIYDAPVDAAGKPLFHHLDRSVAVDLDHEQQGLFRFACDGMLAAISVEDPFGTFQRGTILDYLASCYDRTENETAAARGGYGRGIFMTMEIADLVVFNVKRGTKTEVIALFNVDLETRRKVQTSSFHYFDVVSS